jgi:uncharacterized membrane protein
MEFGTEIIIVFLLVLVAVILIYYMFRIATKQREVEKRELQKQFDHSN